MFFCFSRHTFVRLESSRSRILTEIPKLLLRSTWTIYLNCMRAVIVTDKEPQPMRADVGVARKQSSEVEQHSRCGRAEQQETAGYRTMGWRDRLSCTYLLCTCNKDVPEKSHLSTMFFRLCYIPPPLPPWSQLKKCTIKNKLHWTISGIFVGKFYLKLQR